MKTPIPCLLLIIFGCHSFTGSPPGLTDNPAVLSVDTNSLPASLQRPAAVRAFYSATGQRLFWGADKNLRPAADSLIHFIATIECAGLRPSDYHLQRIRSLMQDSTNVARLAEIDPLLTDAWLALYQHLRRGRLDPKALTWFRRDVVADKVAVEALQGIDDNSVLHILRTREPDFQQYRALREHLRTLLQDTLLRHHANCIALNLERWRWYDKVPDRYISVNIPAFMLRVYESDSLWLETPVIVGKRDTPTPVLESVIKSFIIYPYWHVPRSIAINEILPALQRDRTYLQRNNFDVLDRGGRQVLADTIQWDFYTKDHFPFILRQREGAENSMGIIKFVFANNFGVYLHDTNSKRLFGRARRDLSHGCVRVSNAVALAHYLVHDDEIYVSPEDLDQYLSLQQRHTIDVRRPVTLRLEYFTAEIADGVARFYEDIYKKDSLLTAALQLSPAQPGSGDATELLAALRYD